MNDEQGHRAAAATGVCCKKDGNKTCGRKLRGGRCGKHGRDIYTSTGKADFLARKAERKGDE